ncbi:aldo/keto reductase [Methanoplanus sp. FWC-SCC4]|uniref:Aldo/keto reductase n=1 Tax=Methanochimaera problematica TaxID=2609417 RepID=A0AA97FE55_9EURY|nr:aldo/keto reductase [Methanoplanus sp. FWC-SCC4]WOF16564.1 aldo/keto reductase [Methanoplanus sp. FWC-SCC4]
MLYRLNPKTGDKFSALGFGAMRLPLKEDGNIDEKTATSMLRGAIDCGLNYIDTGYDYHNQESESFLGRALQDGYRQKVNIATKLPSWHVNSREDMDNILNEQLKKLQTDRIDYYLLIALSKSRWEKLLDLGVLEFLDQAKKDGRIKYAGFSFHDDYDFFVDLINCYDWDICQIQYNYLDENFQAGTRGLEYAAEKGIGVAVMMPLRGGHLANNIPKDILDLFKEAEIKRSPAEWGYRWVLNHPAVTVVLSGMSSQEQVDENIRIAKTSEPNSLTYKELELVDNIAGKIRERMKIGCTTCGYCMPCPNGVDIPSCFVHYNNSFLFNDYDTAGFYYHSMLGNESDGKGDASLCINCNACSEKCPQKIDIPKMLLEVKNHFD